MLSWLGWAAASFVVWLGLVGTVAWLELLAGACAAALAATGAEALRSRGLLAFRIEPRFLIRIWRPLVRIVPDSGLLLLALVRRGRGAFDEIPAGDTTPGRRAWIGAAGSIAPNSVVVDVDTHERKVLLHRLVRDRGPRSPL
jgi:hypothetical protein